MSALYNKTMKSPARVLSAQERAAEEHAFATKAFGPCEFRPVPGVSFKVAMWSGRCIGAGCIIGCGSRGCCCCCCCCCQRRRQRRCAAASAVWRFSRSRIDSFHLR